MILMTINYKSKKKKKKLYIKNEKGLMREKKPRPCVR